MAGSLESGIDLFNAGRFFESHEAWEEVWMHAPAHRRLFLQGLIHLAVAFHHAGRGNVPGAVRQLRKGLKKLAGYLPEYEGVDTRAICREAAIRLERLEHGLPTGEYPPIRPAGCRT